MLKCLNLSAATRFDSKGGDYDQVEAGFVQAA
jgi:hypothetical protein